MYNNIKGSKCSEDICCYLCTTLIYDPSINYEQSVQKIKKDYYMSNYKAKAKEKEIKNDLPFVLICSKCPSIMCFNCFERWNALKEDSNENFSCLKCPSCNNETLGLSQMRVESNSCDFYNSRILLMKSPQADNFIASNTFNNLLYDVFDNFPLFTFLCNFFEEYNFAKLRLFFKLDFSSLSNEENKEIIKMVAFMFCTTTPENLRAKFISDFPIYEIPTDVESKKHETLFITKSIKIWKQFRENYTEIFGLLNEDKATLIPNSILDLLATIKLLLNEGKCEKQVFDKFFEEVNKRWQEFKKSTKESAYTVLVKNFSQENLKDLVKEMEVVIETCKIEKEVKKEEVKEKSNPNQEGQNKKQNPPSSSFGENLKGAFNKKGGLFG